MSQNTGKSKPKKPREWWLVVFVESRQVFLECTSRSEARSWRARSLGTEIVRVREVLSGVR